MASISEGELAAAHIAMARLQQALMIVEDQRDEALSEVRELKARIATQSTETAES